jgi:hypothetical protein
MMIFWVVILLVSRYKRFVEKHCRHLRGLQVVHAASQLQDRHRQLHRCENLEYERGDAFCEPGEVRFDLTRPNKHKQKIRPIYF